MDAFHAIGCDVITYELVVRRAIDADPVLSTCHDCVADNAVVKRAIDPHTVPVSGDGVFMYGVVVTPRQLNALPVVGCDVVGYKAVAGRRREPEPVIAVGCNVVADEAVIIGSP